MIRNAEMDMPTPCPICGDIVELNDMRSCDYCGEQFCDMCLERRGSDWLCKNHVNEHQEECEFCGAPANAEGICVDDCQNEEYWDEDDE